MTLALEPEAASMYCRKIPVGVKEDDDGGKTIAAMEVGSKYVVLDQGGKFTVNVTPYHINIYTLILAMFCFTQAHYYSNN